MFESKNVKEIKDSNVLKNEIKWKKVKRERERETNREGKKGVRELKR